MKWFDTIFLRKTTHHEWPFILSGRSKATAVSKDGYILVLTLLVTSVLTIIVTQIFFQSNTTNTLTDTLIKREKAKVLAISGIQLAIDRLSIEKKKEEERKQEPSYDKSEKKAAPERGGGANELNKELITRILPTLNRWQNIEFKDDKDGFDGKLKICICCENGKLNINNIYDFKKHQFMGQGQVKGDYFKLMQMIFKKTESLLNKDLTQSLQKYLADRKFPLNDVTELLNEPAFKNSFGNNIFFDPDNSNKVYLTDIFTIWTDDNKLEPWLLSNSLQIIFGLTGNKADVTNKEQLVGDWASKFKARSEWSKDWNESLKAVYNKDYSGLPNTFTEILNTTFTAKLFSVISYGTISGVTQKVYGILQLSIKDNNIEVTLKKLYWI